MKHPKGVVSLAVVWDSDYSRIVLKDGFGILAESFSAFHDEYEIIGNTCENPRLLKEGAK